MADPPSWPDWITAASTAATALASAIAGYIAWRSFRRDANSQLPIVEADFRWMDSAHDDYLVLEVVIRNQLYETLVLDSARVRRPWHTKISKDTRIGRDGGFGGVIKGQHSTVKIDRKIAPIGTATDFYSPAPGMMRRVDVSHVDLYLSPPDGWDGGTVKVILRISSKSLTIRNRRVVIKRRVNPRPIKQTEDKASSKA